MLVELDNEKALEEYRQADQQRAEVNMLQQLDDEQLGRYQALTKQQQAQEQQTEQAPEQPEVDNLQEAANIIPNALGAIQEDVSQAVPSWMQEDPEDEEQTKPELKTTWGQIASDLFQAIAPVLAVGALSRFGIRKLPGIASRVPKGSWGDFLGSAALDTGLEAGWLNITRQGKTDNLSGMLADMGIPMPDFLATKDSDSPETKRMKQQYEAVGLGIFGTILGALFKLANPGRFIQKLRATDEAGQNLINGVKAKSGPELSDNPVVDTILRDEIARKASDDEMAVTRYAKDPEVINKMDNYVQGDLFDEVERVPRAVQPEGFLEALADNLKIGKDPTGNGRMANFLTDAAKEGLSQGDEVRQGILNKVGKKFEEVRNAGFEVEIDGKWVTNNTLVEAADNLVKEVYGAKNYQQALSLFEIVEQPLANGQTVKVFSPVSGVAAGKITKQLLKEFNPDAMRAGALIQTSLANDLMDSAVASNMIKSELPIERIQERMQNMLETLTFMDSVSRSYAGWLLQSKKLPLDQIPNPKVKDWYEKAKKEMAAAKKFNKEVQEIGKTNPKMKEALIGVYDLTDGSVKDIASMQKAIRDSVKGRRVVKNWDYESPALLVEGVSSIFYAMKLSSLYTPIKAFANNIANFYMKPITKVLGSGGKEFNRAWVQYADGMLTTNKITASLMSQRFKQVQTLPVEKLVRKDIADRIVKQDQWLDTAQNYADATGDLVFQLKVNMARAMIAMGNHPFLRYSTNMMEAGDAAMNVGLILTDKRGKMFDEFMQENGKVTAKNVAYIDNWIKENGEQYVRSQLDMQDFKPLDPGLRYAGGEMAMNLDQSASRGISSLLNKSPFLKSFALFPKTAINSLTFFGKHSPISTDLWKMRSLEGKPEAIERFLAQKGIPYTEDSWAAWKAETKGRVILGSTFMGYAWTMWMAGNMTGNGSYDKATNKSQRDIARRPPRSWRLHESMPWMSYDGIEPISSLLALTIDLADNFDTLGEGRFENLRNKVAYIFADNITNKTFIQGLRPLFEFAAGKPGYLESYLGNLTSVSLFNALGKSIDPAARVVRNELADHVRNKWSVLDKLGIGDPLPYDYSLVTGEKIAPINFPGSSLIPVRMDAPQDEAEEFLTEIEFANSGALQTGLGGAELTGDQISQIKKIIGERGKWRKKILEIKNSRRGQEEIAARQKLMKQPGDIGKKTDWTKSWVYGEIFRALRDEVKTAKMIIRDDAMRADENLLYQFKKATQQSDYDELQRLLNIN